MQATIYGIPNCDTVRKARNWLEQAVQQYPQLQIVFHDVRSEPLSAATLQQWLAHIGRDNLLNKRSTSWRQLSAAEQHINSDQQAVELLQRYPTLMKRPLLAINGHYCVGFNAHQWQLVLDQQHG
ncbi:Spx/MgsR family RNA polymerase-binding regulatory protein [Pseudidiomarina mangrovi]|uniref:Spx/MgsR family RNA polymerase-binding regulatory protein n=1 Tax=Pseudidiomarina mangrovi TaxID=2487133 RepID=UPI000FCB9940|nr:Spx/MgsR family RNA polymerase-binding regulatory protein [Pseudidiomarina mangrovi]